MEYNNLIAYLKVALIIIGIIALGTLAINQTLGYYYKAKFLLTPCQLCEEINNNIKCSVVNPYSIGMGDEVLDGQFVLPKPW